MILTPSECARLQKSCHVLATCMSIILSHVRHGVTTLELDNEFESLVRRAGAVSAFKGYKGYPRSLCTSVNNEVVHTIPSPRVLREGDIVGIDAGVIVDEFYSDMSRTVSVGNSTSETQRLLDVTAQALRAGVAAACVGNTIGDIGYHVQTLVESAGFYVVRALVGHGIGRALHEEPSVPNVGKRGAGMHLVEGMALAIEPMVNVGTHKVVFDNDGWKVVTADGSLSAHMEDTILITKEGPSVLTKLEQDVVWDV